MLDRRERIMLSAVGVQRHREMEPAAAGADGQTWREDGGGQIDRRRRHSSGKQINDILASFRRMDKVRPRTHAHTQHTHHTYN